MNMQQAFNTCVSRIVAQGRPSQDKTSGNCMYHDKTQGTKCAVGIMLSNEALEYVKQYVGNGAGVSAIFTLETDKGYQVRRELLLGDDVSRIDAHAFWIDMQNAHDTAHYANEEWTTAFIKKANAVARKYVLTRYALPEHNNSDANNTNGQTSNQ